MLSLTTDFTDVVCKIWNWNLSVFHDENFDKTFGESGRALIKYAGGETFGTGEILSKVPSPKSGFCECGQAGGDSKCRWRWYLKKWDQELASRLLFPGYFFLSSALFNSGTLAVRSHTKIAYYLAVATLMRVRSRISIGAIPVNEFESPS